MVTSALPMKLSSSDKEKLEKLTKDLSKITWEKGEYFFHNFVDYYQLPQIVRVEQNWNTTFSKSQLLLLQSFFERYLIIASPLSSSSSKSSKSSTEKFLFPDWFQGECRILSKNPILKQRSWVFQGAFELYRFDMPRMIKILADTPAHYRPKNSSAKEWDKIVLRKNARLSVIRRESYQSRVKNEKGELQISEPKDAFVLADPSTGNEFIIPPGVPLRFSTLIEDKELHSQYRSHEGTFTFPEIMMRYEFPLEVEIISHLPVDLPGFKSQVKLEKFSVAKSVLAFTLDEDQPRLVELSPLTQFTLHCAKCLTFGLPREGDNSKDEKEEKFDEKEYQTYESIRSQMNFILDEAAEVQRSKIQSGLAEEIDRVETAFEISMKLKSDEERPISSAFLTLDEAIKVAKQPILDEIPFPKTHPKRFTVHASADPSNPYNEIIDYEDMDALTQNPTDVGKDKKSKKDGGDAKAPLKKSASRDKPQQPNSQGGRRAALVVQQLPPPMPLPPESFERTLKAIPDKLYTEFLPATIPKKADKPPAGAESKSSPTDKKSSSSSDKKSSTSEKKDKKEKSSRDEKKSRK